MTVDTSKRYLFHNVYGDAAGLLASLPADVVAVPAGWDAAAEAHRNAILDAMGVTGYSCLPSLFTYADGAWHETRIADRPKPWSL